MSEVILKKASTLYDRPPQRRFVRTWSPQDKNVPLEGARRRIAVLCGKNVDEIDARAIVNDLYGKAESTVIVLFPPVARTKLERVDDPHAKRIVRERMQSDIELFSLPAEEAGRFNWIDHVSKIGSLNGDHFCIYGHDPEEVFRPALRA